VLAKAAGDPPRSDVLLMLQSLLTDRFGLRLHRESRDMRFLAVVLARADGRPGRGLAADCKIDRAAAQEEGRKKEAAGHAMATAGCAPLSALAELVSQFVETPVFDRTGLTGNFAGTLYFAADPNAGPFAGRAPEPDPGLPSFTSALRDQFGIRLESTRGPVEVMVIDSVRQPTEN
jgi:uncharacterized protein (TIGR03435 family)